MSVSRTQQRWKPAVTVATIIEQDQRFLLVEECVRGEAVFNQPAGHLEPGETLLEAAIRETLEETGWHVELTGFLGVYPYVVSEAEEPSEETSRLRFAFIAKTLHQSPNHPLDEGIIGPSWMTYDQLKACDRLRTPLVLKCVQDYLNCPHYPLDIVRDRIVAS